MNCVDMEEILTACVDGRAEAAELARARRHLAVCADCRARLRWLESMKKAVAGLSTPAMPPDLKTALLREARQAAARRPIRDWRRRFDWLRPGPAMGWGAVFAAAAAALIVRLSDGPPDAVSVDDLLGAHRRYELTMPLAERETLLDPPDLPARERR